MKQTYFFCVVGFCLAARKILLVCRLSYPRLHLKLLLME